MPYSATLVRDSLESLDLVPSSLLHFFEANAFTPAFGFDICAEQQSTLHGRSNGAADQTIEPVIIGMLGADFPFVHRPAASLRFDEVLRRNLL